MSVAGSSVACGLQVLWCSGFLHWLHTNWGVQWGVGLLLGAVCNLLGARVVNWSCDLLVKIFASLQRTGRSPWGRVNQDKIFAFLISSSLFLIFLLSVCFRLINCSLNLFTYNWISVYGLILIYWIVFNHLESGLTHFYTVNCFLGLSLIFSAVHNWLFTGQSKITRVD